MAQIELVDTKALWRSLSPETQDKLGALALAAHLDTFTKPPRCEERWFFQSAIFHAADFLDDVFLCQIPAAFDLDNCFYAPNLNKLGIRQCTGCGRTDDTLYELPIQHWIAPTTCSGCQPNQEPAPQ